jgi:hypothetical protein
MVSSSTLWLIGAELVTLEFHDGGGKTAVALCWLPTVEREVYREIRAKTKLTGHYLG